MSFWMELRCDAGHYGCLSHKNEGPMGKFNNAIMGVNTLTPQAEEKGWFFIKGFGHVCPKCKERRDANDNTSG